MTADLLARALAGACSVGLLATPIARRLALATGFLDQPGEHKSHHKSTPYLGGVAIVVASVVGALTGAGLDNRTVWLLVVTAGLGAVGLVDDRRSLPAWPRLGSQVLAATALWGVGARFDLSGSPLADGVFSVVWMVGLTNAFNMLDNMDGLSAGTAALATLGVAGLALAAGQPTLAITAVAICGACVGFLPYNLRGASIFMGDAGSMFLGASVASLSLLARPPGPVPVRGVALVLVVALPLVDMVTVTLARSRRGISVMQGGRDHLSHRLVKLGLGQSGAVATLLFTEAVGVTLAILVTRRMVGPGVGLALGAAPLAAVWLWTRWAEVYQRPVLGLPSRARWAFLIAGALILVLAAPAAWALIKVRGPLQAGADAAQAGITQEQSGNRATAVADFQAAAVFFARARHRLGGPLVAGGDLVPVVAANLRAASALTHVGLELSRAGQQVTANDAVSGLRITGGRVPLDTLAAATPSLEALANQLTRSQADIHGISRGLLVAPLRRAVDHAERSLTSAGRQARQIADATTVLPKILGANGDRRYFVAIENNAEARATGGYIGNFGELLAQSGHLSQGRFGRIAELNAPAGVHRGAAAPSDYLARYGRFDPFDFWQNVNLSPDFPTVGSVIANLYPQSGGSPIDGVIGIDPVALADILRLTGPIQVRSWPTPITSENVVQVTLQSAYDSLALDARVTFLGDIGTAVFSALTTRDLGSPIHVVLTLAPVVAQHHLQLFLTRRAEEAFAARLGAAGGLPHATGDEFLVTTQNASGNKVDYYLQRSEAYRVTLQPTGDPQRTLVGHLHGSLTVKLDNQAPSTGHSNYALGPYTVGYASGENLSFVSVYSPLAVAIGRVDGQPVPLQSGTERGLGVYSTYVALAAASSQTLAFSLDGTVPLQPGGWYVLDLPHQPVINQDSVSVVVAVPSGWQLEALGSGKWTHEARFNLRADGPARLRVQVRRTPWSSWLAPLPDAFPAPA